MHQKRGQLWCSAPFTQDTQRVRRFRDHSRFVVPQPLPDRQGSTPIADLAQRMDRVVTSPRLRVARELDQWIDRAITETHQRPGDGLPDEEVGIIAQPTNEILERADVVALTGRQCLLDADVLVGIE